MIRKSSGVLPGALTKMIGPGGKCGFIRILAIIELNSGSLCCGHFAGNAFFGG
jgi:hypothetical protein